MTRTLFIYKKSAMGNLTLSRKEMLPTSETWQLLMHIIDDNQRRSCQPSENRQSIHTVWVVGGCKGHFHIISEMKGEKGWLKKLPNVVCKGSGLGVCVCVCVYGCCSSQIVCWQPLNRVVAWRELLTYSLCYWVLMLIVIVTMRGGEHC